MQVVLENRALQRASGVRASLTRPLASAAAATSRWLWEPAQFWRSSCAGVDVCQCVPSVCPGWGWSSQIGRCINVSTYPPAYCHMASKSSYVCGNVFVMIAEL